MLSSKQKINSQDFSVFYRKGIKKSSENIRTSLIFSNECVVSRYSVIISKKNIKTAVLRNKNKRKLYKILSKLYPQFPLIKYGFIFINKDVTGIDKNKLQAEIIQHLKIK